MSEAGDRRAAGGVRDRARHRLEILARQLEQVGLGGPHVLTAHEAPSRAHLRREAETAATRSGLDDLLADARPRFRDWVQTAFSQTRSDLRVVQYVLGASMGPVEDRVDVFAAVDDAVLATVAQGLIPEADRVALLEPFARLMTLGNQPKAASEG